MKDLGGETNVWSTPAQLFTATGQPHVFEAKSSLWVIRGWRL